MNFKGRKYVFYLSVLPISQVSGMQCTLTTFLSKKGRRKEVMSTENQQKDFGKGAELGKKT